MKNTSTHRAKWAMVGVMGLVCTLWFTTSVQAFGQNSAQLTFGGLGQDDEFPTEGGVGQNSAQLTIGGAGQSWMITVNGNTGRLTFKSPSGAQTGVLKLDGLATENLLRIGVLSADTVDINGHLVVTGSITPDYVFTPEYALESIDAHATSMWKNRHLPALAAGEVNAQGKGVINVASRSQGMLEELEKAHIYIEQLHNQLTVLSARVAAIE